MEGGGGAGDLHLIDDFLFLIFCRKIIGFLKEIFYFKKTVNLKKVECKVQGQSIT